MKVYEVYHVVSEIVDHDEYCNCVWGTVEYIVQDDRGYTQFKNLEDAESLLKNKKDSFPHCRYLIRGKELKIKE